MTCPGVAATRLAELAEYLHCWQESFGIAVLKDAEYAAIPEAYQKTIGDGE
jgi:hypothetical protein